MLISFIACVTITKEKGNIHRKSFEVNMIDIAH